MNQNENTRIEITVSAKGLEKASGADENLLSAFSRGTTCGVSPDDLRKFASALNAIADSASADEHPVSICITDKKYRPTPREAATVLMDEIDSLNRTLRLARFILGNLWGDLIPEGKLTTATVDQFLIADQTAREYLEILTDLAFSAYDATCDMVALRSAK